ncbi:MAG: ABC transporter substrate-binding protein [Firmicutes bacterium]|nr:ABC transporter substrate-binding protein [Ezakiella sp.]MDD7761121.1 ABC transporter substrate-binding protein [Bacillota bacterium]
MKKLFTLFLAAALLLTGCSGNSNGNNAKNQKDDVYVFRAMIPKTGDVAVYGNSSEKGLLLAIEEINANGGINGKQIDYKSDDDKGDATEAVNLFSKYLEEGADAILGAITSKPALAVAETSVESGIPVLTPTGTMESITAGKANVFRACFTDPAQGVLLANFVKNNLNKTRVAILRNTSSDYSNGVADKFAEQAKVKALEVVADEGYGDGDNDFKAQLTNIKEKNPEVLLVPDYYEKDVIIAKQVRDLGLDVAIVGPDGWDGVLSVVAEGEEDLLENCYFSNHYSVHDETPVVKNFVESYRKKYNEDPSAFSALSYDAVYLYKAAFEKAASKEYKDVVEALKSIEASGVTGSLKFDENNNPVKSAVMMTIKDGQYVMDSVVEAE